ncbi:MAG: sodium-dependent bicarbonate transport family permease, partial [Rickettsiales bacterium]
YMPLTGAAIGLILSKAIGLDVGTGTLFTVLCASASYIAVPAAMRLALPEAKAAIYIPMSLAITFPFNVALGIPLYYGLATHVLAIN